MKLAIIGSRTFFDYPKLCAEVDKLQPTEVISGGAGGADALGARYANEHNLPLVVLKPQWDKYGKSAGFKRNVKIIDLCDIVIAFWDGQSKGTAHSIDIAQRAKRTLHIIRF